MTGIERLGPCRAFVRFDMILLSPFTPFFALPLSSTLLRAHPSSRTVPSFRLSSSRHGEQLRHRLPSGASRRHRQKRDFHGGINLATPRGGGRPCHSFDCRRTATRRRPPGNDTAITSAPINSFPSSFAEVTPRWSPGTYIRPSVRPPDPGRPTDGWLEEQDCSGRPQRCAGGMAADRQRHQGQEFDDERASGRWVGMGVERKANFPRVRRSAATSDGQLLWFN